MVGARLASPLRVDAQTYELSGTGLETVVLLHGEFSHPSAWQRTLDALTPKYRVLTYARSLEDSLETQITDLLGLLDHLELATVHLIGHSASGVLSYSFAGQHPTRVLSLCLVGSFTRLDAPLALKLRSINAGLEAGGVELASTVAAPWLWGSAYLYSNTPELLDLSSEALHNALAGMLSLGDQRKWLRAVGCPVLVAVGSDDLLTPLRYSHEIVEWVKQGLGVLVTITGGGHNAPLEKPDEFNRILTGFLERYAGFTSSPWALDDDEDDGDSGADYMDFNDLERK